MGGTMLIKTRDSTETGARLNAQVFGQNYKYYKTDEDLFGWSVDAGFDFALGDRGGVAISYRHLENEGQPQEWRTVSASSLYGSQGIVDKELSFLRIGAQDSTVDSTEDQFRLRAQYDLGRSEEHTSELQSLMRISYAVFCLKKKKKTNTHSTYIKNTIDKR